MKGLGTLAFCLCLVGSIVHSQQVVIESPITREVLPIEPLNQIPVAPLVEIQAATVAQSGVVLRALDKVSGEVVDFQLAPGQTKQLGRIQVSLNECRYPTDNPSGDASAHLIIRNVADQSQAFSGWMIATSPALNGLDHSRYDVWVLRCITS
jgi:hypothetical protein